MSMTYPAECCLNMRHINKCHLGFNGDFFFSVEAKERRTNCSGIPDPIRKPCSMLKMELVRQSIDVRENYC